MRWINYIKISLRTLFLHRGFSLITLVGLSVGIAMGIMVLQYAVYQTTFDNHYETPDNIFRVISTGHLSNEELEAAVVPMVLGPELAKFPGVESLTRLVPASEMLVKSDFYEAYESEVIFGDSNVFRVFNRPFIQVDTTHNPADSSSVFLSRSAVLRYFGENNPLGRKLEFNDSTIFTVQGVFEDVPSNSHFKYDFVLPFSFVLERMKQHYGKEYSDAMNRWFFLSGYTYFRKTNEIHEDALQSQFNAKADSLMEDEILSSFGDKGKANLDFVFQPLRSIYLFSNLEFELGENANPVFVFIIFMVAVFILGVTAVNFVNLVISRASVRFKEVGVRKIFGAGSSQIASRFFIESIFFSFLALFIGLVIVELLMPWFNRLFQEGLSVPGYLDQLNIFWILGITLFVGLLSGSYPAHYFSGIHPLSLFRDTFSVSKRGFILRGLLVTLQIFVAALIATIAMGMHHQMNFIRQFDPGFNAENLFLIERTRVLESKTDSLINSLEQVEGIDEVVRLYNKPGENVSLVSFYHGGDTSNIHLLSVYYVDCDFFDALGVEVLRGKALNAGDCADSSMVLINESGANMLGMDSLKDQYIETVSTSAGSERFHITGVVPDVYFSTLKEPLRPAVFVPVTKPETSQSILISVYRKDMPWIKKVAEPVWERFVPGVPFLLTPVTERISSFYKGDIRYLRIAQAFSLLALFIVLLGLIGLVSFILEFRRKEMVILKLSGAPGHSVFFQIFKGYFGYVTMGVLLSLPFSFKILNMWLGTYAFHVGINWFVFFLPILLLITMAVLIALAAKTIRLRMLMRNIRFVSGMNN